MASISASPDAPGAAEASAVAGTPALPRWRRLNLRVRLVLLGLACVLPIICLGTVREYLDYRAEQARTYEQLTTVARAVSLSVGRDLQLYVTALQTLALSRLPAQGDFADFDAQARLFLGRLPAGSGFSVVNPDLTVRRFYRLPNGSAHTAMTRIPPPQPANVFTTKQPVVTNMRRGQITGNPGFSIDVPVIRDGQVVYALMLWVPSAAVQDLLLHQYLSGHTVVAVVDAAGTIVARVPSPERYVGDSMVRSLWTKTQRSSESVTEAQTMEGNAAIAAFTHIEPFNWVVAVGAPQSVVFSRLHAALLRLAAEIVLVMAAVLLFGTLTARGIIRPIERLRRIAEHDDRNGPLLAVATGLPEIDVVAAALARAAAERRKAARELAESEQRFRAVFERSASGTILIDPETMAIVDCNEAAAAFLGYDVPAIKGRLITDFDLQASPDRIRQMGQDALAGKSGRYETKVIGRSGPRDLLNAVAPVQLAGRALMLVNQIDVTDLRRAEAGLRANEERLELARQGASLGIWDWDLVNDILTWSEHQWFLHDLDPRPGGPTPQMWRDVLHPDDRERVVAELVAAVRDPTRLYVTEYSVQLRDGSVRRLLARGQAVRDEEGRTTRIVGINMDVTARYEAEMARDQLIWMLETERGRLSEIIEALPLAAGIIDSTGRVVLGNAQMHALAGPVVHSMADNPSGEWIAYDENGNRLAVEDYPIRRALAYGEVTLPGRDFRYRGNDGKETWIRVGALPLRRENGSVTEALGFLQDIDAEKRLLDIQQQINARLEQRVREEVVAREAAQQRAAHAERMHALGQIAGGIAHDFNNVLQAVAGGAALIERRPREADRVLRNARMVLDAARRGAAITSRLLAFARRGDLRAEAIDAAALLTDMAEVLTHTLGGAVVCVVDAPPGLPKLYADRGQLETVLVNLATNARDAMPSGGTLALSAEIETVSADLPHPGGLTPGVYVRLAVKDSGCGMEQSVLARVTEPFFTTKEPGKGTGLGLAMAKGFAEQSGGSLSIESAPGRGTRVILWLPVATDQAGGKAEKPASDAEVADRRSVLLVDDDPIVRDVLSLSLEDAGYAVHTADCAAAALARLEQGARVDIIVSDLTMPGMDGITFIRAAQERRPGLPAILLTGYAGDGAALAIGGAITGTFSLLRKPVSGTQLLDRISVLLVDRRSARVR